MQKLYPIIQMLATSSACFARLKQMVDLQLPNGFPMKLDLPLTHTLSTQITFKNVMSSDRAVPEVNGVLHMCGGARTFVPGSATHVCCSAIEPDHKQVHMQH